MTQRKSPAKGSSGAPANASPKADPAAIANREAWLNSVAAEMVPHIERFASEATGTPQKFGAYRVSCGWPSKGGLPGNKSRVRGQCWDASCSGSGHAEIYISPVEDKADEVADILSHELVHALLGTAIGHKQPFPKIVKAMGLDGKPTATFATDEFWSWAGPIVDKAGPYPHAAINASQIKKPSKTYLLKMEAPCGAVIRMTQKIIDEHGAPFCHCPACDGAEYEQA